MCKAVVAETHLIQILRFKQKRSPSTSRFSRAHGRCQPSTRQQRLWESALNVSLKVFKKKLKLIWNDIHLAVLHRFNSCVHLAAAVVSCDSAYAHIPANLWCIGSNSNSYQYADVFFSFSLKEEATLQNGLRQTCPRLPILATTASATMRSSRYTFYRNTLDLNNNYKYSRKRYCYTLILVGSFRPMYLKSTW